ncbi:MAG: acylphosphatase [Thermoprotei archaeon]|nr:MAG: acylphosphatase [Thermoprotei archaeon]RLE56818.1 MAG: acylphosphatase [Thermoprotei archaeon]
MVVRRARIIVKGLVQGVGFRYFIYKHARMLGLRGYVRNLPSGREVEIVVEGDEASIQRLIEAARRGSPLAIVESIEVEWEEVKGDFKTFTIVF